MAFGDAPSLILDKSAFEMLSKDEHFERECRYRLNVLPVLVREIRDDVMSRDPSLRVTPERRVQGLAQRFFGSGDPPNIPYQVLCVESLRGNSFAMDGRPVPDGGMYVDDDGTGESAVLYGPTPMNREIMRMADGRFSPRDRIEAATQRLRNATFSIGALEGRLHGRAIRRPTVVADIATVVDELLAEVGVQKAVLDWLMERLFLPLQVSSTIRARWERAKHPPLAVFAPYAHFCARILLMLMVATKHGTRNFKVRATNRVDIEYLLYAPFCEVFVSEDTIHKQLAPLVLRPDQSFRAGKEFKEELKRQWAERQASKGAPSAS